MSTSFNQVAWVQQRWSKASELKQHGWRSGAIATALEVPPSILNQWFKEYPTATQQRIPAPKRLAPATALTEEEQRRLYRLLQRLPSDFGFTEPQWTTAQVQVLIEQLFDIALEERVLAETLHALDTPPKERQLEQQIAEAGPPPGRLKKHNRVRKLQLWALDHRGSAQTFATEPAGFSTNEVRSADSELVVPKNDPSGLGKFKSGPPTKLTLEQLQTLPELLLKPPQAYGFTGTSWTYKQIAHLIEQEYHVSFSPDYIPDFLKRARRRLEKLSRYLEQQQKH